MTELRIEDYIVPAAGIGPENPLPRFRLWHGGRRGKIDDSVPEEDRRYFGWRTAYRVLPYKLQDGYDRDKQPRAFKAAVLENEHLKATVLPEIGGRLVSLIHKPTGRELFERNPVFQPANLGLRNAWFSGGVEWNAGLPGHHYLTCSPVFAARIEGNQGEPALRIYEWDRVKRFSWQVDLILPPGSPLLYARVRLVNPHDQMIPMYWWTNIAVPERAGSRTLAPASTVFHGMPERGLTLSDMPCLDGYDASYPTNAPHANEHFFKIARDQRKWVASLDGDGTGLFQASTARLMGRKLFVWGMNPGGRWWQRHLASGNDAYVEIQAGLARTQWECIPMSARTQWAWTEAFGLLESDASKVHSANWSEAWHAAEKSIENVLPQDRLDSYHAQFAQITARPPKDILAIGSGWGALERRRKKHIGEHDRVPQELVFDEATIGPDQQPWVKLLETGSLPETDSLSEPGHFMIQPEWRKLLEHSTLTKQGDHWLAWYHLGVACMESRDPKGARTAWEKSLECKPNGWVLRNLARMELRKKHKERACELLREAWNVGPKIAAIALEYAELLVSMKRNEDLCAFVATLPEHIREHERIQIMSVRAAIRLGDIDGVEHFFDREFSKIREGEITLTELWFAYQAKRVSIEENIPIDDDLRERVRREFPPPKHIDFRMR